MKNIVISVENLSKTYRLGQIGTGTFTNDLKLWWAKIRGKPNPLVRIGEKDQGNQDGDEIWALKDVTFKVEQGEVLGIIGRNGAGKSTLLKILSRVTAPTSGKVKVKGRIASLLEVGTGFHPELTGRENIYLNGTILGMNRKEINRKFDEIVGFAEVEKFIDTPVKRYSSGMYVRLAFAVAAHLDPEILIVDEVLAVGDAEFQKRCLGKMGDVAKEGRTVLFVSHNMGSINALCNNGILLDSGFFIKQGPIDLIINTYLNSFKSKKLTYNEKLLEQSPISLISVELTDRERNMKEMFLSSEEIWVKILFRINDTTNKINPVLNIIDEYDNVIISSSNFNETSWYAAKQDLGVYQSVCKIPKDILNNRNYFIDIFFVEDFRKRILILENRMQLSIQDSGKYRDIYGGNWSGLIRPYFTWETNKIR